MQATHTTLAIFGTNLLPPRKGYFDGRAAQAHGPNSSQPATYDTQREVAREASQLSE